MASRRYLLNHLRKTMWTIGAIMLDSVTGDNNPPNDGTIYARYADFVSDRTCKAISTQIAKTLESTWIRHRTDAKVSDRSLIHVDPMFFSALADTALTSSSLAFQWLNTELQLQLVWENINSNLWSLSKAWLNEYVIWTNIIRNLKLLFWWQFPTQQWL